MVAGSQVVLSEQDRRQLNKVVSSGTHPARTIMRARVLLALAEGVGAVQVAHQVGVSQTTVRSIIQRYVGSGGDVETTITRRQRASPRCRR